MLMAQRKAAFEGRGSGDPPFRRPALSSAKSRLSSKDSSGSSPCRLSSTVRMAFSLFPSRNRSLQNVKHRDLVSSGQGGEGNFVILKPCQVELFPSKNTTRVLGRRKGEGLFHTVPEVRVQVAETEVTLRRPG